MDNKTYLRALPINAYARKFVFIFMTICSLFLCSNVFAADYTYNGETIPEKSKATDTFFGVDTMVDVLNKLELPYDDTTKIQWTYYVNQYMKYYIENIDSTIKAYNVCFAKPFYYGNNYQLNMYITNGTYSDTLKYMYIWYNYQTNYHTVYLVNQMNGTSSPSLDYGMQFGGIKETTYYTTTANANTPATILRTNEDSYTNSSLYLKNLVAPYQTYTVVSTPAGYVYYFLENTYEFSGTDESGDVSGDTSGDNTDITERLDKISNDLGRIEEKIPTSGDIQQATTAGVTSGLTDYFGGSGDANFEDKQYTSGEVLEKIDFKPIENPNANFWLELTNILNNALTGSGGQVVFKWFGNEYTITPNQIVPPYPNELQILLTTVSTVVVILIIAKWVKIIADTSQEGNLDQLLEMNEEGIVNLF